MFQNYVPFWGLYSQRFVFTKETTIELAVTSITENSVVIRGLEL